MTSGPAPDQRPGGESGALAGFTIAITASRRAEDSASALRRHGAEVVVAPTMCTAPLADDAGLIRATERVLAHPPDFVLITTAMGFRGWLESADTLGVGDRLRQVLADTAIVARGPKATGAIRAAGLRESWSSPTETTLAALHWLAESGGRDARTAVQLHGDPDPDWLPLLQDLAAEVSTVPVYRWLPAPDPQAVASLIDSILAGSVDAIVFTSARRSRGCSKLPASAATTTNSSLRCARISWWRRSARSPPSRWSAWASTRSSPGALGWGP